VHLTIKRDVGESGSVDSPLAAAFDPSISAAHPHRATDRQVGKGWGLVGGRMGGERDKAPGGGGRREVERDTAPIEVGRRGGERDTAPSNSRLIQVIQDPHVNGSRGKGAGSGGGGVRAHMITSQVHGSCGSLKGIVRFSSAASFVSASSTSSRCVGDESFICVT